jgi:magnesium-transporting ATPase (P-type)
VQVDFVPFDPTLKRTEGTLKGPDGKTFKCSKGAPHIILKLVEVDQEEVAKRVNWKVCTAHQLVCAVPRQHYRVTGRAATARL